MTKKQAINLIRYRIDTATEIAGKGADGKAFEDLEMAIKALEELNLYEENELCLIPSDVYEKQCEELDRLKEKDSPMKLLKSYDDEVDNNWCFCPICHKGIGWFTARLPKHCPECGQRIER